MHSAFSSTKYRKLRVAAFAVVAAAAASVAQATIHVFQPRADYEVSTTNIPIAYFATESSQITTVFLGPFTRGVRLEAQSSSVWVSPQQNVSIASTQKIPHYDPLTKRFAEGELIDGTSFQNAGSNYLSYTTYSEFTVGETAYLGFITDGHFGWARVERIANGVILKAWAYEDAAGTPIAAGDEGGATPPATVSEAGRIMNMSVRASAGVGEQTLIVGYVVSGGGSKAVLLRGVGPALAGFGVAGFLADPAIALYAGANAEATNQDWANDTLLAETAVRVGAFALASQSKDAALLATSAPGAHTLHVAGGTSGVALAEIYDAAESFTATDARLVNVSARAQAGGGEQALIAGFVIGSGTGRPVLIRAVGPGLAERAVTGALADPQVILYAHGTKVAENNNWSDATNAAAIAQTSVVVGAFPLAAGSKDAAILTTLEPGVYTAHVTGVNGATGVALVEIYEVPVTLP